MVVSVVSVCVCLCAFSGVEQFGLVWFALQKYNHKHAAKYTMEVLLRDARGPGTMAEEEAVSAPSTSVQKGTDNEPEHLMS